jgi:Xaa-Pro aminopeptidase
MAKTNPDGGAAIPTPEYQARRQQVFKALNGAASVVFAGEGSPPLLGKWRADQHFVYLTGIEDEPGAAVLFDPTNENPRRRIVLFLRPIASR